MLDKTLPSGEHGIWNVDYQANSFEDLAAILRNLQELEKELQQNPTREMLAL